MKHEGTLNDETAQLAVALAFSLIQQVVGSNEDVVILTETRGDDVTVELWLYYNRHNPRLPFVVTNDRYGTSNRTRRFATLPEAACFYRTIRAAGSWGLYYEDHPDEEKRDKNNG